MSVGRELRIAVPWLADVLARSAVQGEAPHLAATEWLLARGRSRSCDAGSWRDWLLAGGGLGAGVLEDFPAGPCARAAVDAGAGRRTWARAEPVHLLTALDHLQLAAPVPLPLEAQESTALLDSLNAHLDGTGFALQPLTDGGWLLACPDGLQCTTAGPAEALGRNLREWLPTGRDATRLRALVNELQMVLHPHPVNERRAARGLPAVNSVWCWGIGPARPPAHRAAGDLLTDDAWLAGLWRIHGGRVGPPAALAEVLSDGRADLRVTVAGPGAGAPVADALQALEAGVLEPARDALVAARLDRLSLLTGARVFELSPTARWAVWRRRRPLGEVLA